MARIVNEYLKRQLKERNTVHDIVTATYDYFEKEGEVYFQIDTYGRLSRENPEKISQSIQVDKDMAVVLIKLLRDAFELE